jgi:hypothetical protein|tara:strand:- start:57 stop:230 length:174 start_codon:yes stop_codon:yes gene_type:complete
MAMGPHSLLAPAQKNKGQMGFSYSKTALHWRGVRFAARTLMSTRERIQIELILKALE